MKEISESNYLSGVNKETKLFENNRKEEIIIPLE